MSFKGVVVGCAVGAPSEHRKGEYLSCCANDTGVFAVHPDVCGGCDGDWSALHASSLLAVRASTHKNHTAKGRQLVVLGVVVARPRHEGSANDAFGLVGCPTWGSSSAVLVPLCLA